MEIILENAGKRYNRNWIFRDLNYNFTTGNSYAILGPNGSGKSTALQLIAGYISPTRGKVSYLFHDKLIEVESIYRYLSLAAPYMDLPEEFTLNEILKFHSKFKRPLLDIPEIIVRLGLEKEKEKEIRFFSSGMRQRVKLAMAILFESEIILLDEPSSHLDKSSTLWYRDLIRDFMPGRLLIISSNQPDEYDFCDQSIGIEDFKPQLKNII